MSCRPGNREEDGFTLVELLVAMTILITVTTIVSTAIISLSRSVAKENGFVDAQAQTRLIFERLDTQIRYASSVYAPTIPAADNTQWIDWEVPDPSLPAPSLRCYQWESIPTTGVLQYRTWVVPASGSVTTPAWTKTFTGLVVGAVPTFTTAASDLHTTPYNLPTPPATQAQNSLPPTLGEPQVGVTLSVAANKPTGSSAVSTVFTALNATSVAASPSCSSYVARS